MGNKDTSVVGIGLVIILIIAAMIAYGNHGYAGQTAVMNSLTLQKDVEIKKLVKQLKAKQQELDTIKAQLVTMSQKMDTVKTTVAQ